MKITVEYFDGKLPIKKIKCTPQEWPSLHISTVQRVLIEYIPECLMILSGFDYYWIREGRFGVFNNPLSKEYKGVQANMYVFDGERLERFEEIYPPPGTHCLAGIWMPKDLYMKAYGYGNKA